MKFWAGNLQSQRKYKAQRLDKTIVCTIFKEFF